MYDVYSPVLPGSIAEADIGAGGLGVWRHVFSLFFCFFIVSFEMDSLAMPKGDSLGLGSSAASGNMTQLNARAGSTYILRRCGAALQK